MEKTIICSGCSKEKDVSFFPVRRISHNKVVNRPLGTCRDCRAAYQRKYRANNHQYCREVEKKSEEKRKNT